MLALSLQLAVLRVDVGFDELKESNCKFGMDGDLRTEAIGSRRNQTGGDEAVESAGVLNPRHLSADKNQPGAAAACAKRVRISAKRARACHYHYPKSPQVG